MDKNFKGLKGNVSQSFSELAIIGEAAPYKSPKTRRMIKFDEVAKFMNHDVFGETRRQKQEAIIEIEIAFDGTAAPFGTVIFDRETFIAIRIDLAIFGDNSFDMLSRSLF